MWIFDRDDSDWREFLNHDARHSLEEMMAGTLRHRGAWKKAGDRDVAQLWAALVEMRKELEDTKETLFDILKTFYTPEVEEEIKAQRVVRKLEDKVKDSGDYGYPNATQRLIESLMKF